MADNQEWERLARFILHGRTQATSPGASVDIADSITLAELETTVEGADTLTVTMEDEGYKLLRSDVLTRWTWGDTDFLDRYGWIRKGRAVDVALMDGEDRRWFRLVKVSKAGTALTLVFEDRMVTFLRHHKGARKLSRAKGTRAMFFRLLAQEVKAGGGIPTFIPELTVKQPISKPTSMDEKVSNGEAGIAEDKTLWIADANGGRRKATTSEKRIMERVLDVCEAEGAGDKATLAAVEAVMIESQFRNLAGGDADSRGVLQVRDQTARGMGIDNRKVEAVVKAFLLRGYWGKGGAIEIAKRSPSRSAGWVAQQTQGSAHPERYDAVASEARAIVASYGGSGGRVNGETYSKSYEFARGKDEDSWTAMGRLAEEVHWRRFIRKGRLWYASEEYLFNQKAAMVIDVDEHPAVEAWDFDLDIEGRAPVAEVKVQVRLNRWVAIPGMVVELGHAGPCSGRWLVSSTRRQLHDDLAEVTLHKPVDKLPEPPHEVGQRKADGDDAEALGLAGGLRSRIVAEAKRTLTSRTGFSRYDQSGALTQDPTPRVGRTDCSQWARAVYLKAGAPDPGTNTIEQFAHGKRVAHPKPGDLVLDPTGVHHVELYVGDGKTIGHGSPPIDYWTVDGMRAAFGGVQFRSFVDGVDPTDDNPGNAGSHSWRTQRHGGEAT